MTATAPIAGFVPTANQAFFALLYQFLAFQPKGLACHALKISGRF